MRQKGRSRSERGDGYLEYLAARINQALASLGEAELNLRNISLGRLSQVAESLEAAATDVKSLRGAMSTVGEGNRNTPALRESLRRVEYAAGRVSALHQAARDFHAGLMLARQGDTAEYDALGGVCGKTDFHVAPHGLEARG